MDLYSRYPEVHIIKGLGMKELTKVLNRIMRTHRWPNEIWSNGGPPCNSDKWPEKFNQNLKLVILAANTEGKDSEEEVNKYVVPYRNTPHSIIGQKITC